MVSLVFAYTVRVGDRVCFTGEERSKNDPTENRKGGSKGTALPHLRQQNAVCRLKNETIPLSALWEVLISFKAILVNMDNKK